MPTHHPQEGHEQIVEQLLKAGADMEKAKNDGATPLFVACQVCVNSIVLTPVVVGTSFCKQAGRGCTCCEPNLCCDQAHLVYYGVGL